mmetsp:Transcript_79519/g.177843  ORF Transcript_79519/g.177843 Transcript_79519/m.177843 type:complete len:80 (-) Transcript_79519:7-246(-)
MFSPTARPPAFPYIVLFRPPSRHTSGLASFESFFSHLPHTILRYPLRASGNSLAVEGGLSEALERPREEDPTGGGLPAA